VAAYVFPGEPSSASLCAASKIFLAMLWPIFYAETFCGKILFSPSVLTLPIVQEFDGREESQPAPYRAFAPFMQK
jgi:hypothetical protein